MGCCKSCLRGYTSIPSAEAATGAGKGEVSAQSLGMVELSGSMEHPQYQDGPISSSASAAASYHSSGGTGRTLVLDNVDMKSCVFQGSSAMQKFTQSGKYQDRFIWVSLESMTINLSEHKSKEKRHKEAFLVEMTSIIAGPPAKLKKLAGNADAATAATTSSSSSAAAANNGSGMSVADGNRCLTIKFNRGGGIDLMFESQQERDCWNDVLNEIMIQIGKAT